MSGVTAEPVLYVRSKREIVQALDAGLANRGVGAALTGGTARAYSPAYAAGGDTHDFETARVVPEEQSRVVAQVRELAEGLGTSVRVIDLGHWEHVHLRREARRKGWTRFPVLVGPTGGTLVGCEAFTADAVRDVLRGGAQLPRRKDTALRSG